MASKDRIDSLTWNRPIVTEAGSPTPEFMVKWQQLSRAALSIPSLENAAAVSHVLDYLTDTPGSILRRGAAEWEGYPSASDPTKFLSGANPPAWASITDADLALDDVTTNDVSTTKHGFAPKLPNDATKYLDGTGNYTVPAGGGGGGGGGNYELLLLNATAVTNGATTGTPVVVATVNIPANTLTSVGEGLDIEFVVDFAAGLTGAQSARILINAQSLGGFNMTGNGARTTLMYGRLVYLTTTTALLYKFNMNAGTAYGTIDTDVVDTAGSTIFAGAQTITGLDWTAVQALNFEVTGSTSNRVTKRLARIAVVK